MQVHALGVVAGFFADVALLFFREAGDGYVFAAEVCWGGLRYALVKASGGEATVIFVFVKAL